MDTNDGTGRGGQGPNLVGSERRFAAIRERAFAAVYFRFDMQRPLVHNNGLVSSVNFPGYSYDPDPKVEDCPLERPTFILPDIDGVSRGYIVLCVHMYPNVSTRELHPEVVSHVGPSKLLVEIAGRTVGDFPPGMLSMEPEGRFKLPKPWPVAPRSQIVVQWDIVNDDVPAPVTFTVGLEGILTRDVS